MRVTAGVFAALAVMLLLSLIPVPALGQASPSPFTNETRYIVPAEDGKHAAVFYRFTGDPFPASATVRVYVPPGAGPYVVKNDTHVALDWAPAGRTGLDVGVPGGTRALFVSSAAVPIVDGRLEMLGQAGALDGQLLVALPTGTQVTSPEMEFVHTDQLDARWPLGANRTLVGATWQNADVPLALVIHHPEALVSIPVPLLTALIVFLVGATLWALHRVHRGIAAPTARSSMPIMDHLAELRKRVMWVIGTLVGGTVFFFGFGFKTLMWQGLSLPLPVPSLYNNAAAQTFAFIASRVVAPGVEVIVTNPFDAVLTQMGLAIGLAVLVTFPVLFYHIYAFLAPGLKPIERRAVLVAVPFVVVLFLLGGAFGLLFMMPFTIGILYSFAGTLSATAFLNVHDLVSLAVVMALVFGIAFQLPLVMGLTARLGLVSAHAYRSKWRHALLVIAIISALVTDPTVITQLIVAGVLSILYIVGLLLAYAVERRQAATDPTSQDAGTIRS